MTLRERSAQVQTLLITPERAGVHLQPIAMSELGWKERSDLQAWVRAHPSLIGPDLLLISEEFAEWEGTAGLVHDRLDLLFLDSDGHPVVAELKRGLAPDRTESQALVYAAYCDQLSTTDLVEQYARHWEVDSEAASEAVTSHAPVLLDDQPGRVRVRLLAEDFPQSVTATVLFLRELGSGGPDTSKLDIGCIKLTAYALPDDAGHVLTAQPIIPVPETEAYQVRRRRRDADDETSREKRTKRAHAIPALQQADAIPIGTRLYPNLEALGRRDRDAIEKLLQDEPQWTSATWTGEHNAHRAVTPSNGDEPMSLDAYYQTMREAAGLGTAPNASNAFLVETTERSIRQMADELAASTSLVLG